MDSSIIGTFTESVRVSAGDTAIELSTDITKYTVDDNSSGTTVPVSKYYSVLYFTVEENDVRIRFGSNPTQGADAQGHLVKKDTSMRIVGRSNIENLRIIGAVSGQVGILQVSAES